MNQVDPNTNSANGSDPAQVSTQDPAQDSASAADPIQPTPAAPAAPANPADGPAKKSPLEILEEILAESQQKAAATAPGGDPGAPKADGDTAAAAEAERQAEIAKQQEEQRLAQDKLALEQKIAELKQLDQTPENQARLSQLKDEAASHDQEQSDHEGFEIRQIDHDKV